MNDLIKRLRESDLSSFEILDEAADRLTAMKAAGDGLAGFAGHKLECCMGKRLGRQYCTCGMTDKLKQWKEASDV